VGDLQGARLAFNWSRPAAISQDAGSQDSLPEWSKGMGSSATSASCVGSNPTADIFAVCKWTTANTPGQDGAGDLQRVRLT